MNTGDVDFATEYNVEIEQIWNTKYDLPTGFLLIEGKYIFSPKSNKWRVKGKNQWCKSKGLDHFIENFVLKNRVDFNLLIAAGILNGKHEIPRTRIRKATGLSDQAIKNHAMTYLAGGYAKQENDPKVTEIVNNLLSSIGETK